MMPTAMAAVSDMIEISRNVAAGATGAAPLRRQQSLASKPLLDVADVRSRYYLRFGVLDKPGVLGQLTTLLGQHDISIQQVVQEGARAPGLPVRVFVLTHEAREGDVQTALAQIGKLGAVAEPGRMIRIAG
jgi:homoserine dehydrogenase